MNMHGARNRIDRGLILLVGPAMVLNLFLIFYHAPVERTMGLVQKIFYIHVPAAWVAFLAFFVVFAASIAYLASRRASYDRLAEASAAVGVLFCTLVLATGPIWAKPVWGIWWTWDARLTSTLVLWFLYIGYLLLRSYVPDAARRATLSAVLGIVGFLDVPIVYLSIRWWRTQHPSPVFAGGEGSGLDPRMRAAFFYSLAVFTLLFVVLLRLRMRLRAAEGRAEALLDERRRSL
ncbi:MAG: cytochrome c biogenesis protein CcsA [Candidatus Eisenbacteria bacterium]|nr:cytochrome c biogenesis protein CcsA [Candidatus Eisenbacteria bacterium]